MQSRIKLAPAMIATIIFTTISNAADITFDVASGDWNTPGNWDSGTVPGFGLLQSAQLRQLKNKAAGAAYESMVHPQDYSNQHATCCRNTPYIPVNNATNGPISETEIAPSSFTSPALMSQSGN